MNSFSKDTAVYPKNNLRQLKCTLRINDLVILLFLLNIRAQHFSFCYFVYVARQATQKMPPFSEDMCLLSLEYKYIKLQRN